MRRIFIQRLSPTESRRPDPSIGLWVTLHGVDMKFSSVGEGVASRNRAPVINGARRNRPDKTAEMLQPLGMLNKNFPPIQKVC